MGDYHGIIPLADDKKIVVDSVTIPSTVLGFAGAIPWPTVAAFLACLYTGLRIIELVYSWVLKRKKK